MKSVQGTFLPGNFPYVLKLNLGLGEGGGTILGEQNIYAHCQLVISIDRVDEREASS